MIRKRPTPTAQQHRRSAPPSSNEHVAVVMQTEDDDSLYLQRAPPPKPPLFLPDAYYHDFIQGKSRHYTKPWIDLQKLAKIVAGFSLVAILFLLWVSLLASRQALYIKGIRPSDSMYASAATISARRHTVALAPVVVSHAQQAAVAYFITLIISILYGWNVWWRAQAALRRRHYRDIPDHHHVVCPPASGGGLLPTFYSDASNNTVWNKWGWKRKKKPKRG